MNVGKKILEIVNAHLPKPPPNRPYISSVCLQLIEERNICWRNNFQQRYNELNKCIAKEAAKHREHFINDLIETTNLQGLNLRRPFVPKPVKIEDLDVNERPIQDRASVLAQ